MRHATFDVDNPNYVEVHGLFILLIPITIILLLGFAIWHLNAPPQPPPPLQARVAIFDTAEKDKPPLTVVLGGGSYELIYETVSHLPSLIGKEANSIFTANFSTGETSGNLKEASTIVMYGAIKLAVGYTTDKHVLYANIVSRATAVNAYFNFATSERGPPAELHSIRKQIYVIGTLANIAFGDSYLNSKQTIKLLELEPTAVERRRHEFQEVSYTEQIEDLRIRREKYLRDHIKPARERYRPR